MKFSPPNTVLPAWLIVLLLLFSSLTNAGHWHEVEGPELDCILCLQDSGSEPAASSAANIALPPYVHHQISAGGDVVVSVDFAAYSARAPPVFN